MDTSRRRLRTLALARALSRRRRRRGGRGARPGCSRRGPDRGRRGRGLRGAHAWLDRTVASQLDCSAPARHRARSLVAARRRGRCRSRTATGPERSETPCAVRTGPRLPRDQARLDRPACDGIEVARRDSRRPAAPEASYTSAHIEASREAGSPVESRPGSEAPVTVDLVLRARRDRARRARPRRVDRRAPALHANRLAAGATTVVGRRAYRPGHRCLGLDANAAGSLPAAAGRGRLARRGGRRASDGRRSGRRRQAAAGARGGDDESSLLTRRNR